MPPCEIQGLIQAALPGARVLLEDLSGEGTHYAISVTSDRFRGMSDIDRMRAVAAALRGHLGRDLRAVSLHTSVPDTVARGSRRLMAA